MDFQKKQPVVRETEVESPQYSSSTGPTQSLLTAQLRSYHGTKPHIPPRRPRPESLVNSLVTFPYPSNKNYTLSSNCRLLDLPAHKSYVDPLEIGHMIRGLDKLVIDKSYKENRKPSVEKQFDGTSASSTTFIGSSEAGTLDESKINNIKYWNTEAANLTVASTNFT